MKKERPKERPYRRGLIHKNSRIKEVEKYYLKGKGPREIARIMNLSVQGVWYHIKKLKTL